MPLKSRPVYGPDEPAVWPWLPQQKTCQNSTPQTRCFAIRAEQGHGAISPVAALGVGVAPELRHRAQRLNQHRPEGICANGVADCLLQRARESIARGRIGRPTLRFVLVVGGSELGNQWALHRRTLGLS